MSGARAERALIFAWERVRRVPLVLPAFLLLAFLGPLGAFFLSRVVSPPQASLPMPPPEITMLDPSRPDHQALLRWAEAEDTAPAGSQAGITELLLHVPYRPSFATARTAPLSLPEPEPAAAEYPPARDPLALIRSADSRPLARAPLPRPAPTRVTFSAPAAARARGDITLALEQRAAEPLETAQFLIGITDRGEVRFAILQHTSGNAAVDAEAAAQLTQLQLAPAAEPILWAHAFIHWSADAFAKP